MTLKVFIYTRNSTLPIDELRRRLPANVELQLGDDVPTNADFEILVHGFPTREQVEASPRLRAVIAPFAGAPKETIDLLRDYPHIALHSVHYNVAATAELAIGLMLAAAKFIIPLDRELRNNDWRSRYGKTSVIVLDGRTVTILGYGRIGQRIGAACQAMGMKVVGVRRHVGKDHAIQDNAGVTAPVFPPSAIPDLLPRSDILIVALPLTAETEDIIGRKELALLPAEAIVVNVGRGPVINEEALFTALQSKQLLGAGLDVWYQYPQRTEDRVTTAPSRFPFHTLDNVVMSPHRGGFLSAAEGNRVVEVAALLTAAAQGHAIPSAVDKELGY
jgi:phosphoglycerate dehydrogenase-like enzyme